MRSTSNLPGFTAGVIMNNSLYQYDDNTDGYERSDNSTIEPQALRPIFRAQIPAVGRVGGISNGCVGACAFACAAECIGVCIWNRGGAGCTGCTDRCMGGCAEHC